MSSIVIQQLKKQLDLANIQHLWVGYSGGMDSHVLLHALVQLRAEYGLTLEAIHVDHGLTPQAPLFATHCKKICEALGVNYHLINIAIKPTPKKSVEEAARDARYHAFKTKISHHYLATAHHADDQTETFLLQLLRGAGTKGLSGMATLSSIGKGWLWRPFLSLERASLIAYAKTHQLEWIEDESNMQLNFDRNYLRHKVIPALKNRWPHLTRSVCQSATHCAETETLVEKLAETDYQQIEENGKLNLEKLAVLPKVRRHSVLRFWLKEQGFPTPGRVHLAQFEQQFMQGRQDANPKLVWASVQLRRYQNFLYALPKNYPESPIESLTWDLREPLLLPHQIGVLIAKKVPEQGISCALLGENPHIEIRFRKGGETIQSTGKLHHHRLKKQWQTWKIPPFERNRTPLLYIQGELAQIIGPKKEIASKFATKKGEKGWVIQLIKPESCNSPKN